MLKRFIVLVIGLIAFGTSSVSSITAITMTTNTNQTGGTAQTYAALGDSIAAGAGLTTVPNASTQDTQCARSTESYPYRVAQQANLQLVHIACSGATAGDLYTVNHVIGPNIPAQLDTAFSSGTPQLITITAGANDLRWADFLRACYTTNCATNTNSRLASLGMIAVKGKLAYAFNQIQYRSNGSPPLVIVTGYYNPISNYCKNRQPYATVAEINFLNTQRDTLNQTIRDAAAPYPFVKYASANFTNHGLCAAEPWSQGLNDPAPLHPTNTGQQKIAESILNVYNN